MYGKDGIFMAKIEHIMSRINANKWRLGNAKTKK